MIEDGFSQLLTTATSLPVFPDELPKDFVSASNPTAISFRPVTSTALYTLTARDPFTRWVVQVNVHGFTAVARNTLAKTIVDALDLYHGTLGDGTVVQGIFTLPSLGDGFDIDDRTFVRGLQFEVIYLYQ